MQNTLTGEVGDYLSLPYIGESHFITEFFLYAVFARAAGSSPDASMQPIFIALPPLHGASHELFQTFLGLLWLFLVPGKEVNTQQGSAGSPGAGWLCAA